MSRAEFPLGSQGKGTILWKYPAHSPLSKRALPRSFSFADCSKHIQFFQEWAHIAQLSCFTSSLHYVTAFSFPLCFLAYSALSSFINNVQLTLWAPAAYRVTRSFSRCTRCGTHPNNGAVQIQACLCPKVISGLINRLKNKSFLTKLLIHRRDLIWKPLDSTIKKYKCPPHSPPLIPFPVFPSPPLYYKLWQALTVYSGLANPLLFYSSYSISTAECPRKHPTSFFILWNTWHNFGSY